MSQDTTAPVAQQVHPLLFMIGRDGALRWWRADQEPTDDDLAFNWIGGTERLGVGTLAQVFHRILGAPRPGELLLVGSRGPATHQLLSLTWDVHRPFHETVTITTVAHLSWKALPPPTRWVAA